MSRNAGFDRATSSRVFEFLSLISLILICPAVTHGQNGVWVPLDPPTRQNFSLVHDLARNRLVLFGGLERDGGYRHDVRSLALQGAATWHLQRPLGTPPDAREAPATAYDSRRGRMLIFGGFPSTTLGIVWSLDLADPMTWNEIIPVGVPPAIRAYSSAVYDSLRDRVLLFGGLRNDGTGLNDVWELTLSGAPTWTQLSPSGTSPAPRAGAAAILDPVRDRLVVFGGGQPLVGSDQQTWALSLSGTLEWRQVVTSGTPPDGVYGRAGIYDPVGDRLLTISNLFYCTPMALSLGDAAPTWSQLTPSDPSRPQPPGRYFSGEVYDPVRHALVICGGYVNNSLNDTWSFSFDQREWTKLAPLGGDLPARAYHTATLDSATNRVIVYGGKDPFDRFDVWALNLEGSPGWIRIATQGAPPDVAYDVASACDTRRHRMLYFGGQGFYHATPPTVWALDLNGTPTWSQLSTTGTPPSNRTGAVAIYDPVGDRLVIFGGLYFLPFNDVTNEVWSLSLSGTPNWTRLSPGAGPTGRAYASASYDPARNRMLVFGGFNYGNPDVDNDIWELSLGDTPAWNPITASGAAPEGRFHAIAVVDPTRDRLLIHGGGYSDVWAVNLSGPPQWNELEPALPRPDARRGSAGVYDVIGDRMIVTGGQNSNYTYLNDSWALSFAHSITAGAGPGGSISPSGTVSVREGGSQTFTIRPDDGFAIADVIVDEAPVGPIASYTFTNVTIDHSISASFAASSTVSIDLDPNVINLKSNAPWVTAYIEPSGFDPTSIGISTVRLAGSVPPAPRFANVGDHNRNGIPDLMVKFSRAALDPLLTLGVNSLEVSGSLVTGESFAGTDEVRVIDNGAGHRASSVAPNPLNPSGVLFFNTDKPGRVSVRVFDLYGCLVRTLMETPNLSVGKHAVRIDGRGKRGEELPSGVYFYQVNSADGTVTGRFAILK